MQFVWHYLKVFLFVVLFFLGMVVCAAQVNPDTNIRWPMPSCATHGAPYNPADNICTTSTVTGGLPVANPQFSGTLQGPLGIVTSLLSSVNNSINVMAPPYNAKGDCVTDDQPAITAAQAASLSYAVNGASPAVLYFPKPPGGCYLVSTIQWQGVPLEGPNAGPGNTGGIVLKGKPGQDILHAQDPTGASSAIAFYGNWYIRNIGFKVDDTVSTVGAFPHRFPGRWTDDVSVTAGNPVLQYANRARINCGDVGQAIQINGAGASGANLVTTIQSVTPCWTDSKQIPEVQVTLAAAPSTTLSGAHTYISVNGYSATYTIGNAAIAMDDRDGNPADWPAGQNIGALYPRLENVWISSVSFHQFGQNGSAGIFTQGGWGPYGIHVDFGAITRVEWGIAQVCAEINSYNQSCSNDFQRWQHLDINAQNPATIYNGLHNRWEDIQLNTGSGMVWLSVVNTFADYPDNLIVSNVGWEGANNVYGFRYTGDVAQFRDTDLSGYSGGSTAYLTGSHIDCDCQWNSLQLGGAHNRVRASHDESTAGTVDAGRDNTIIQSSPKGTPYQGMEPSVPFTLNWARNPFRTAGIITPDFLNDGNVNTPYNKEDLLIWPNDIIYQNSGNPYASFLFTDASSPTGQYLRMPNGDVEGTYSQYLYSPTGNGITPGLNVPTGGITMYADLECAGGTSGNLTLGGHSSGSGYYAIATAPITCSTSQYQVFSVRAASVSGSDLLYIKNDSSSTIFKLAWLYFRPDIADINGISVSSMVSVSGNTSANHVSCWTGARTLGYCTNAPASDGTCTCSAALFRTRKVRRIK
jgi:hypothetical protein